MPDQLKAKALKQRQFLKTLRAKMGTCSLSIFFPSNRITHVYVELLLSAMIRAEEDGEKLTREEIVTQCDLLLVAGKTRLLKGDTDLCEERGREGLQGTEPNPTKSCVELEQKCCGLP